MSLGEPLTILLVEDDPAHVEIVRRSLAAFRVANRVVYAADGQAALDYLMPRDGPADSSAGPRPHLVLLDLRLPKVDGLEVLRQVKADATLRSLPVAILTTSTAESDMVDAYALGAGAYLVKPVDMDKLTRVLGAFGFYWLAWNRHPGEPT